MDIKEARKWTAAFKKAKFKCIVPNQVIKAFNVVWGQKASRLTVNQE